MTALLQVGNQMARHCTSVLRDQNEPFALKKFEYRIVFCTIRRRIFTPNNTNFNLRLTTLESAANDV